MEGSSACSAGGGRELESGLTGLPAFYHHGPKPGHRPVHRAGWGRGLLSVAGTCRGDAPRLWIFKKANRVTFKLSYFN